MSEIAIKVERLGKIYKIGQRRHDTLRDKFAHLLRRRLRVNGSHPQFQDAAGDKLWALQDVSFEIKSGEVVGVIGGNGAGKSTLLKVLSRITEPSEGYADIKGRVGSLLEVGTGFHPELTGRENIFLNGSILGMKRVEIQKKFDEMVAFAEIERFIDTPVKHYSSGMYVRLAFAVAAHLDPDILLIDEVLAVGDASFQKKCLGKIGEVARAGRTALFVSHNMAAVENLCSRAILLNHGKVLLAGNVRECVSRYLDLGTSTSGCDVDLSAHPARHGESLPLLTRVRLLGENDTPKERFTCGEPMKIELTCDPVVALRIPQFGVGVNDWMGTRIFSLTTYFSDSQLPPLEKPCRIICSIGELPLAPGRYTLSLSAGSSHDLQLDTLENAASFDVDPVDYYGNGRSPEALYGRTLVRSQWERATITDPESDATPATAALASGPQSVSETHI